jgi:hypothetical protein
MTPTVLLSRSVPLPWRSVVTHPSQGCARPVLPSGKFLDEKHHDPVREATSE